MMDDDRTDTDLELLSRLTGKSFTSPSSEIIVAPDQRSAMTPIPDKSEDSRRVSRVVGRNNTQSTERSEEVEILGDVDDDRWQNDDS